MLTQISGRSYALGLQWSIALSSREAQQEAKTLPKANRVIYPSNGQYWLGLDLDFSAEPAYAAALVVGSIEPNSIICHPLKDETSWVCALLDGLPAAEYDVIVPSDQARDLVSEWGSIFAKSTVYIGNIAGSKMPLEECLAEFDRRLADKADKAITRKLLKQFKLVKPGVSVVSIGLVMLVLAIPVAGFLGYTAYKRVKQADIDRNMSIAAMANQALNAEKMAAERAKKIALFESQVAAKRLELAAAESSSQAGVWRQWQSVRTQLPLVSHGYSPMTMNCERASCSVNWLGQGLYTLPVDKRLLPGVVPNVEPTLKAISVFPIAASPAQTVAKLRYESPEALRFALASAATAALPSLVVDPMQPVVLTPPPELKLPPVNAGTVGKWRVVLQGPLAPLQVQDAFVFLDRWPVEITSLRYGSLSDVGEIEIQGNYVLASSPR